MLNLLIHHLVSLSIFFPRLSQTQVTFSTAYVQKMSQKLVVVVGATGRYPWNQNPSPELVLFRLRLALARTVNASQQLSDLSLLTYVMWLSCAQDDFCSFGGIKLLQLT